MLLVLEKILVHCIIKLGQISCLFVIVLLLSHVVVCMSTPEGYIPSRDIEAGEGGERVRGRKETKPAGLPCSRYGCVKKPTMNLDHTT